MKYEITLITRKEVQTIYMSNILPVIGDMISITQEKMFIVENRILHAKSEKQIILNGKMV